MRTIPASVQSILDTGHFEPICFVKIYWSPTPTLYADKAFPDHNINGDIVELSTIEDVRDLSKRVFDVTFSIKLNDINGFFKNLISTRDINGVKVQLFLWFQETVITDAVMLFDGVISSPVTYSEGDKSVSFTVLNRIFDLEFGFSPEEGQFKYIPIGMVGKAWPMIFGKVARVPAPQFLEEPSIVAVAGLGVVNELAWALALAQLNSQYQAALNSKNAAFAVGINEAYLSAQYDDTIGFGYFGRTYDPAQAKSHHEASQAAFRQAAQYEIDARNISIRIAAELAIRDEQRTFQTNNWNVTGYNVPNNQHLRFKTGDLIISGVYNNGVFSISGYELVLNWNTPRQTFLNLSTATLNQYNPLVADMLAAGGKKFHFITGGTRLTMLDFPLSYVAAATPVTVSAVWGKQHGVWNVVPTDYYTIDYPVYANPDTGREVRPTVVTFKQPLTSYNNPDLFIYWEENKIWCDVTSSLPTNTADIITYVIDNYTTFGYDVTSFAHVRTALANYPMNFAMLDRINTMELVQKLAYQARCVVWTNDDLFYIRYLPEDVAPVVTLTLDDVELNSVVVTNDPTEKLTTKYIAEWRPSLQYPDPFEIIYRYNIVKYGLNEVRVNYFAYNNIDNVKKSAEFWLIRTANSWKHVRFNLSLQSIALEAFDPVEIDFGLGYISDGPVTGIIEKCILNTETDKLVVDVWVPIRFGENKKYIYATPQNVQEIYPVVTDAQIDTGNPGFKVRGELPILTFKGGGGVNFIDNPFGSTGGRDGPMADANDNAGHNGTVGTYLDPGAIKTNLPPNIYKYNDQYRFDSKPYVAVEAQTLPAGTFAGVVLDKIGTDTYLVEAFLSGTTKSPTTVTAQCWPKGLEEDIGTGTPVGVVRQSKVTQPEVTYIIFPPVWAYPV